MKIIPVQKTNPLDQCQLKFDSKETGYFSGYASVFGNVDSDGDVIHAGAYKDTLASGKTVQMFFNHDNRMIPPGDYLSMKEDDVGLFVEGQIDFNHHLGKSLYSALMRKAVNGLSPGFLLPEGGWSHREGVDKSPYGNRDIHEIDLMEISIVNYPANGEARIADVKSAINELYKLSDFERFLRDVGGFTNSQAKAFVSELSKAARRDADSVKEVINHEVRRELGDSISNLKKRLKDM